LLTLRHVGTIAVPGRGHILSLLIDREFAFVRADSADYRLTFDSRDWVRLQTTQQYEPIGIRFGADGRIELVDGKTQSIIVLYASGRVDSVS
jgi:hypothetical protein